jgi:hypothetical protein
MTFISCLQNKKGQLLEYKNIIGENINQSDNLYYCDAKRIGYISFSPA